MEKKVDQMNLAVIQRTDPDVTDILDKATQVAVYGFDETAQSWVCVASLFEIMNNE
jgi:hypothetical protein